MENTDVNFNTFVARPSVDALQEFKVQTGVYSAEFGRSPSQINVNTKPANNYHGVLFEFRRNDAIQARLWPRLRPQEPLPAKPVRLHSKRTSLDPQSLQRPLGYTQVATRALGLANTQFRQRSQSYYVEDTAESDA